MTANLMVYGIAVALLIGLAGLAFEQIAARTEIARRGIWVTTLILSVAFPTMRFTASHRPALPEVASLFRPLSAFDQNRTLTTPKVEAANVSVAATARESIWQPRFTWPDQTSVDRLLIPLWLAASLGLVALYALLWLRLRFAARRWRRESISGQQVWVTEELGPAVYGFIRPIILMPQWVLDDTEATRSAVFAHEQEHIGAQDPRLLLLGLLLVAIVPWNLPLWWQLRRLRFAIEVDCDARVLKRGTEPKAYGGVLLSIGQRRSLTPVGAIALIEPASQLLRRIQILTAGRRKRSAWFMGTAAALSLACIAVAADLQAPPQSSSSAPAARSVVSLLKPPLAEDPRLAQVQALARATFPELFGASAPPGPVLVTLLLNKDGTLFKSYKENTIPRGYFPMSEKAFAAMGVDGKGLGGCVRVRMPGSSPMKSYVDVRAWYLGAGSPTRPNPEPWAPNDDPAVDRAIAERYFPDLYTYPQQWPRADAWVLLNRQGEVIRTGRRVVDSVWDEKLYLESLYPGIKTAEVQTSAIHDDKDQEGDVAFVWLAKDSPVTDPSAADFSKRKDLVVFADVSKEGELGVTNMLVLDYGSTALGVSARANPYGVAHLQITAQKAEADSADLDVRLQHAPLGIDGVPHDPLETAWPGATTRVRVPIGSSGTVQLRDQDQNIWNVVLYADRLKGS